MQDFWDATRPYPLYLNIGFIVGFILITGCSVSHDLSRWRGQTSGVYHIVERGQTLWRIARAYGVDLQELAEVNDITDTTQIKVGQRLFIPGASRILEVKPYHPGKGERVEEEGEGSLTFEKGRFIWPVKGEIVSPFGIRDKIRHDGIDISAPAGTPIVAADDGEVVHSSNTIRGYGNMIIIKHQDGFYTIYAHNAENLVKVGDRVKKGDTIARVGNTGNASGYHLHFEIRNNRRPRNPLFFLP